MSDSLELAGSLGALSLTGLLQLMAAESRSGRLDVTSRFRAGSLWLEGGQIVHAASEADSGTAALDSLIALTEGSFRFVVGDAAPARSLHGPTEQVLMEAAVRNDHARRSAPLPASPSAIPSFAPVPEGGSTPRFTTLQWRVLAAIDGRKTVQAIADEVQVPVAALAALIGELDAAGVIQIT